MTPYLKPLEREHLEFVRALRNANRQWFFNTKPVTEEQQGEWYVKYLKSTMLFWVIYYDDRPVGTISQTPNPRLDMSFYEIGNLMLLPSYQGKGIMQKAIQSIMKPNQFYTAHVKSNNTASLRVFKNAGFWRVPKKRSKRAR